MKTYTVVRKADGKVTCTVSRGAMGAPLKHVVHHSPTGFETGYGGSGPADLALSILADYFSEGQAKVLKGKDSYAWLLHEFFKTDFIEPHKLEAGHSYEITEDQIKEWAVAHGSKVAHI